MVAGGYSPESPHPAPGGDGSRERSAQSIDPDLMEVDRLQWFRFWHKTIDDPRLLRLPPDQRWVWVAIYAMASESPKRGSLYASENLPHILDDIVRKSHEPPKVVEAALAAFQSQAYGMLGRDEKGAWVVLNWPEEQPSRDDSKERVAQNRGRKHNAAVTQGVPPVKRGERVTDNAAVTRPDSDTDSDTEIEKKQASQRAPATLPDRSWIEALEEFVGRPVSPREMGDFQTVKEAHGLEDELIFAVLAAVKEKAKERKLDRPLIIARNDLADLGVAGVRTVADWDEHKKAKNQGQRPASGSAPSRASPTAERQAQGMATLARLRAEAIAEEEAGD